MLVLFLVALFSSNRVLIKSDHVQKSKNENDINIMEVHKRRKRNDEDH